MSASRKARRAAERAQRAREKVLAGGVTRHIPAPDDDETARNARRLLATIEHSIGEYEPHCQGDRVIHALWLDADDLEYMRALSAERGLPPLNTPAVPISLDFRPRADVLAECLASGAWSETSLDLLRSVPVPGSYLVVFDGSACGHGVSLISSNGVRSPADA